MTDELKFPGPPGWNGNQGDDERDKYGPLTNPLLQLMRDAYAPPVANADGAAYWNGLQERIMTRASAAGLAGADSQWWSVLGAWAQTGLIAAAAIFAVAGVINQRVSDNDSQFVYESVVQPATPESLSAPVDLLSAPAGSRSDATLGFVLSH